MNLAFNIQYRSGPNKDTIIQDQIPEVHPVEMHQEDPLHLHVLPYFGPEKPQEPGAKDAGRAGVVQNIERELR